MKKKLYILTGTPGCGKSTWAQQYANNDNWAIISRDKIRFSKIKGNDYFGKEDEVFDTFVTSIVDELCSYYTRNVIADATHISVASRRKLIKAIRKLWPDFSEEVEVTVVYFDISFATCLKRNNQREGMAKVPPSILKDINKKLTFPSPNEFEELTNIIIVRE